MIFVWSVNALYDLGTIRTYIAHDNDVAAQQIVDTLMKGTESQLSIFPKSGRKGRVKDTYTWNVPKLPYIVFYRLHLNQVHLLRVHHTGRTWPRL